MLTRTSPPVVGRRGLRAAAAPSALLLAAVVTAAFGLVGAPAASADDPGRWSALGPDGGRASAVIASA
ncbi:MAG: hypothetical protein AAFY88_22415, partial [Acidobacteriota bacterium]